MTAQKFIKDKRKTDEEKVNILFEWWHLLDYSGQTSLALNDHDARLMKIKDRGQKYRKSHIMFNYGQIPSLN